MEVTKWLKPSDSVARNHGIWLCQSCSKLIDSDENHYTVALLHQWKKQAVQRDDTPRIRDVGSAAHQPAGFGDFTRGRSHGNRVPS